MIITNLILEMIGILQTFMLEVREPQILRRYQIEDREDYTKLLSPQQVVYNVTYNSRLEYIYIYIVTFNLACMV